MFGKDLPMRWDQIEEKWATMTRRIRADWRDGKADASAPGKVHPSTVAQSRSVADADPSTTGHKSGNLPTAR
jgi:hypothetical protein